MSTGARKKFVFLETLLWLEEPERDENQMQEEDGPETTWCKDIEVFAHIPTCQIQELLVLHLLHQ